MADKSTRIKDLGLRDATVRALARNGVAVVGDLLDPGHTRAVVASWPDVGTSRLADLDAAMGRFGLAYGSQRIGGRACESCAICADCGNPRTDDPRHVAIDVNRRYSHLGHRVGPTCDGCDTHHRGLFGKAAAT